MIHWSDSDKDPNDFSPIATLILAVCDSYLIIRVGMAVVSAFINWNW